jgi:hypothetical protein
VCSSDLRLRELAIERYYKNPNYCLQCGKIIDIEDGVRPSITKIKKFCSLSCAATYNNLRKEKKFISDEEKSRRKERDREHSKKYRIEHKEETQAYAEKYRSENKEKNHTYGKKRNLKIKTNFIEMYGNKCACCGEKQIEFLTLDHIDYSKKGKGETGSKAYMKALAEYRPDLYQVLCYNCNCARRHGICPHKK